MLGLPPWDGCHPSVSPGDRDLQLPRAAARRCRRAQAVPLITSNTAGCSVGSLRVAGLISRIHLSRKTVKSDSMGTGEACCAEVSETLLCKRQRDKTPLGPSLVPQHPCWCRGYWAAKTSAVPCPCPASPTASRQMHRGVSRRAFNPRERSLGRNFYFCRNLWSQKASLG